MMDLNQEVPISAKYLFVYGSLRRQLNHPERRVLDLHSTFVGVGELPGRLFNVGDYPGAIYQRDSADFVVGELYQLKKPELVLPSLDDYEECCPPHERPWEFIRTICTVRMRRLRLSVRAWCYLYNHNTDQLNFIGSDYLDFLQS